MPTIKYLDYDGLDYFWDKINAKKQDKLTAGSNITISGNTISATNTTYSDVTTTTHGLMTAADKVKLNGIATGAEVNVQSDWSVTDTSSDAFIKNKPAIPTVNNGTLTIQKNGTNVQTFTANASSNVTANITVPTQTSELTNNSGFLTSSTGVTSVNGNTGAVTGVQTTSNLVTSVSSSSTNAQYPSAKLFYDTIGDIESVLQTLNNGSGAA